MCHDLPYAMFNLYDACATSSFRKLNLTDLTSGKGLVTHVPRSRAVTSFKILVSRPPKACQAYGIDVHLAWLVNIW